MQLLGHTCHQKVPEHLLLTGEIEGKMNRGKQRGTSQAKFAFLDKRKLSWTTFLRISYDRNEWIVYRNDGFPIQTCPFCDYPSFVCAS